MIRQVFRLLTRFGGTWWAWNFYVVCLHVAAVLLALGLIAALCRRAHPSARAMVWNVAPLSIVAVTYLCFSRLAWIAWLLPGKLGAPLVALTAVNVGQARTDFGVRADPATDLRWIAFAHGVWILGLAVVLARAIWNSFAASRAVARLPRVEDTALLLRLRRARATVGLRRRVTLRWGEVEDIPTMLGVFRPTIVIPRRLVELTAAQQDAVLLHELAHVRRNDLAAQMAMQLVCAWYWFLPLVWWAAQAQRTSREDACDSVVLSSGIQPSDYAACLLAIAGDRGRSMSAGIALARPRRLVKRLRAVLAPAEAQRSPAWASTAVLVSVTLVVVAFGSARLVPTRGALWAAYGSADESTRAAAAVLLTAEPDRATRARLAASAATEPSAFVRRILAGR
jgi:beta-lactamase regulating signal transducer with metallopeptidase domain